MDNAVLPVCALATLDSPIVTAASNYARMTVPVTERATETVLVFVMPDSVVKTAVSLTARKTACPKPDVAAASTEPASVPKVGVTLTAILQYANHMQRAMVMDNAYSRIS